MLLMTRHNTALSIHILHHSPAPPHPASAVLKYSPNEVAMSGHWTGVMESVAGDGEWSGG